MPLFIDMETVLLVYWIGCSLSDYFAWSNLYPFCPIHIISDSVRTFFILSGLFFISILSSFSQCSWHWLNKTSLFQRIMTLFVSLDPFFINLDLLYSLDPFQSFLACPSLFQSISFNFDMSGFSSTEIGATNHWKGSSVVRKGSPLIHSVRALSQWAEPFFIKSGQLWWGVPCPDWMLGNLTDLFSWDRQLNKREPRHILSKQTKTI